MDIISHLVIGSQDVKSWGLTDFPTFQYIIVMFWFSVDTVLVLEFT